MSGVDLELGVAWSQHVATGKAAEQWRDAVLAHYRADGRHYHDVRHVGWVVRHAIELGADRQIDHGAVVAAAFFHDAIYEPARHDNEQQSARLATRALTELGWDGRRCDAVARMVMATVDHRLDDADEAACVLIAADLAVLATEPNRYADYVRAVRKEYAAVDDEHWMSGRSAVLRRLLERPRLFPGLAPHAWESRARANITAELATLAGR